MTDSLQRRRKLECLAKNRRIRFSRAKTAGFTIIELLVVISLIAVLLSILLPAVQNARMASRRAHCLNNLRNLTLAVHGFESANQRFPAAGNFAATGPGWYHGWVVSLLPWIDRNDLYDRWDFGQIVDGPQNRAVGQVEIDVLICPVDVSVAIGKGNLSYVVNSGFGWTVPVDCPVSFHSIGSPFGSPEQPIDLNGDGLTCSVVPASKIQPTDQDILFRTGLFFLENWPLGTGSAPRYHSIGTILDGSSNTIMMTENIRAGYNPQTDLGWASPLPRSNAFILSGYACKELSCIAGNINYQLTNDRQRMPFADEAINSALEQAESEAPWPSSYHHGGIGVSFADGSVRFVNEMIDGRVYSALVSPQGQLLLGPLAQAIPSDGSY